MSKIEEPTYKVERVEGSIEVRTYPSMIIASTTIDADRSAAIQKAFGTLAGYIFGANDGSKKIEMTAPVMQTRAASGPGNDGWSIRFVMPKQLPMTASPQPRDKGVNLAVTETKTYAVIRFSGWALDAQLEAKTNELAAFMAKKNIRPKGTPVFAFYNPPWTLPIFRRNEVMIEVDR